MTYRRMLYIFAIIQRNHFKMYMFGVVGETRAHDFDMSFPLNYVICLICISKKLKYLKNEARESKNRKITYSVILSVLSNKTNLILGFSSPLKILALLQTTDYVLLIPSIFYESMNQT